MAKKVFLLFNTDQSTLGRLVHDEFLTTLSTDDRVNSVHV